jgi:hypothetical protein
MEHNVQRPLSAPELAPWLSLMVPLLMVLYAVTLDQGALTQSGQYLHELLHDGRHLLGVPCH